MKYTVEGFGQSEAIKLGLDVKDLVLLRWIVDFYNTGCMSTHLFDEVPYFWINYQYVLKELPVLGITSKDVLARRMKKMAKKGLLYGKVFESAGHKTYFRFNKNVFRGLLSSTDSQGMLFDSVEGGSDSKVGRVPTQKSEGFRLKSRNHVDSSIIDSSINDIRRFMSPSFDDVKAYAKERYGLIKPKKEHRVDPEDFFLYYESINWMRGKTRIKNWKACFLTWEKKVKNNDRCEPGKTQFIDYNKIKLKVENKLGNIATDEMIRDVLREVPEKAWWIVKKFLNKRYPESKDYVFSRIEIAVKREINK